MYVCMCMCARVRVCVCIVGDLETVLSRNISTCISICVYACVCAYACVCVCVCVSVEGGLAVDCNHDLAVVFLKPTAYAVCQTIVCCIAPYPFFLADRFLENKYPLN